MSVTHVTRKDFVKATGALLAAGALGCAGSALAADGASEKGDASGLGIIDALANRQTLHGLEGSMYDPDQPVSEQDINAILAAGFSAPTAVGQQCLEFVVVTDRDAMLPILDHNENANELKSCPVLICLVEHDGEDTRSRFYQYDSGIAAMAMVTQASALGLCSCIMSMKTEEKDTGAAIYYDSIGLAEGSDEYHPQLMVSLGYPAVDSVSSASVSNYDEARIHENTIEG